MKILYLNCWHGKLGIKIIDFFKETKLVDIYCLQEVSPSFQVKLENFFNDYQIIYKSIPVRNKFTNYYGQSIFVRNGIKIKNTDLVEIFLNRKPNYGFLQIVEVETVDRIFRVANLHGRSQPGHKLDTTTRIDQSKRTVSALKNESTPIILGGDFNLDPQTRSVKLIEESGLLNLINEFKIKTTRNRLAWNTSRKNGRDGVVKYYNKQYFADYCFVSTDIKINKFSVPNVEISDHLPLILEFDI